MFRLLLISALLPGLLYASSAMAADAIQGNWTTESGETASIAPCGSGNFCITLKTGSYAGKKIGTLANSGGVYKGKITDPSDDKTYSGKASISGATLKMSGCVLAGLICRSQNWKKQ